MPSLSVLRDWQQQAEYFFQGWTPEHSVWVGMCMGLGIVAWLAWGRRR